jgi:ankyrin repeat protein
MNGYLNVVRYLYSMGFEWNPLISMNYACIHGHIDVVRYLDKIGAKCGIMAMNLAIANGHLEVVKFLKDTDHTICMESALLQAKIRNKDDIMVVLNGSNIDQCKKSVSKLSVYRFSPLLIVIVFILLITHYIIKIEF